MKEETKTQKNIPSKGSRIVKTILNTVINILIVLVLITSLLIAVMALTSKSSGISTIFGTTIQPIQSDSMKGGSPDGYEGGDYEKGDLMLAKATNYDNNAVYDLGDIVTFKIKDTDGNDALISHRIVNVVKGQDGTYSYQTQGDNREMAKVPDQQEESDYIHAKDIASVFYSSDYQGKILKGWGAPIDYLKSQQGFFFVVLLPMIIFFMYELIRVVLNASNYKRAKADEAKDAAVKEAVAAALAEKEAESAQSAEKPTADTPAGMTAEELEQFRQFQEFQKMQKAQQQAAETESKPEE